MTRNTVERIKGLPSAQPETHEKRTETHACDLISRQAAIDAVSDACFELRGVFGRCEDALKALPSAQPEPKTGQWIPDEIAAYDMPNGKPRGWVPWLCSECGYCVGKHQTRFCPDCGALMCGKAK